MKRFATFALTLLLISLFTIRVIAQEATPDPNSQDAAPPGTALPLPTMSARPAPVDALRSEDGGTIVQVLFSTIAQGQIGILRAYGVSAGGSPIASVSMDFLDRRIEFFPAQVEGIEDSFYGILSAGMAQNPRTNYALTVNVTYEDGSTLALTDEINVILGAFIGQNVTLPPDTLYLLDAETERNELARMESIFAGYTLEKQWDDTSFQMPIANGLTSPFGAFRIFNDSLSTRHTGWDIRTTLGVPVMATQNGRVVFAGHLEIRGNNIIVDHGYGVFSTYSHLSVINVTAGETVSKGQILGLTGATGRTSGPHFHWEMAVNGDFVDSVQFVQTWMP